MKALVIRDTTSGVKYDPDYPLPQTGSGGVLVQVKAAALNHRDVWITKGKYPGIRLPVIPGSDACGLLEGQEVVINPNIEWGDLETYQSPQYRILGTPENGTFAEFVCVPEDRIEPKPRHLNTWEAAALPLAGLTAYRVVRTKCEVQSQDRVLITGIGGGVAQMCLQFCLALGAEVHVTSSENEKIRRSCERGAKGGMNYNSSTYTDELKSAGPFDVIIDSAGGPGFATLLRQAAYGARVCMYGGTAGSVPDFSPQLLFWKQVTLMGSTMGSDREFRDMLAFVEKFQIKPVIHGVYPLAEGERAFSEMASGKQFGKIILQVSV